MLMNRRLLLAAIAAAPTSLFVAEHSVEVSGVPSSAPRAVLVRLAGDCTDDLPTVTAGKGPLTVGDLPGAAAGCAPELAVFVQGAGLHLDANPDWVAGGMTITASAMTVIPLNVWVVSNSAGRLDWAASDIDEANRLLDENLVGMQLTSATMDETRRLAIGSAEAATIGQGCDAVPGLVAKGPPLYEPAQVNVYFVSTVVFEEDNTYRGYTCTDSPGNGNIVYVSLQRHTHTTLAHELGHVLTLQHSNPPVSGFDQTNLMWSYLETAKEYNHRSAFSLGQAYRMNVDQRSWVNRAASRGMPPRTCQDDDTRRQPCPALHIDRDRGAEP